MRGGGGTIDEIFSYDNLMEFLPDIVTNIYYLLEEASSKYKTPYISPGSDAEFETLAKFIKGPTRPQYFVVSYWDDGHKSLGVNFEAANYDRVVEILKDSDQYKYGDHDYYEVAIFNSDGRRMNVVREVIEYTLE